MKTVVNDMLAAVATTVTLAVLVCGAYPMAVFALAQGLFPNESNGSIAYHHGTAVGSALVGQAFKSPQYFHPRPSAAGAGYDAAASGGSNLGPTSKELMDKVQRRVRKYREENHLDDNAPVPADAVAASGSGLDPHISIENAMLQAPRVAKSRGWDVRIVTKAIRDHSEGRTLGILGESRVNVLQLNLALDEREKPGK